METILLSGSYKSIICSPRAENPGNVLLTSRNHQKYLGFLSVMAKSWMPFWSYQLDSTANPAHLLQKWAELSAVRLQTAAKLFIFSIPLGTYLQK